MSKLGSQMQQLLDQQMPGPAARSAPPSVATSCAVPADVVSDVAESSSHRVIKNLRISRQEEPKRTDDGRKRSVSPQVACPTPERLRPRQQQQAGSTTDGLVAKIHSLALLLDPDDLDAAIADLQRLQQQQQQAMHTGADREDGRARSTVNSQLRAPATGPVPTLCSRMRLAQTKRAGPNGGRWNGSKMFDSCPDLSTITRLRHTVAAAASGVSATTVSDIHH